MKKLFGLLTLALAGTACQQQAPVTQGAAAETAPPALLVVNKTSSPATVVETAPPPVLPVVNKTNRPATASPLTSAARDLLRRYDLSALFGIPQGPEHNLQPHVLNGFFGAAHRRIEVLFTDMRRDASQPNVYYLSGKNRHKGVITPFAGTLTITKVVRQPGHTNKELVDDEYDLLSNEPYAYTAVGQFVLREDSTREQAGMFRGEAAIDWAIIEGKLRQHTQTDRTLTQGGLLKFEGTWSRYHSAEAKPVVWVESVFGFNGSRNIIKDLQFADRNLSFNPKYAKLGWNEFYENDEWWADTPKATSSL